MRGSNSKALKKANKLSKLVMPTVPLTVAVEIPLIDGAHSENTLGSEVDTAVANLGLGFFHPGGSPPRVVDVENHHDVALTTNFTVGEPSTRQLAPRSLEKEFVHYPEGLTEREPVPNGFTYLPFTPESPTHSERNELNDTLATWLTTYASREGAISDVTTEAGSPPASFTPATGTTTCDASFTATPPITCDAIPVSVAELSTADTVQLHQTDVPSLKRASSPKQQLDGAVKEKKKRKYTPRGSAAASAVKGVKGSVTSATSEAHLASAAAAAATPDQSGKKGPRSSKLANFRICPLTASTWPLRFGFDAVTATVEPDRSFYPPGDNTSVIEVYQEPHITGVSIGQYPEKPYENRINLSANDFRGLFYKSEAILEHVDRITKEAAKGLRGVYNYVNYIDAPTGNTQVLVNLYRGKPKVHIGTRSYIDEMNNCHVNGRLPTSNAHCGHTVSVNTIADIQERVGPLLEVEPNFYKHTTECDD